MGRNIVDVKEQIITTNEGMKLVRRVRTVRMPNGRFRYPVDYYDATPGAIAVTPEERQRISIPLYSHVI